MRRFIIYKPSDGSYVQIHYGNYWTSGHHAAEVNSYKTLEDAENAIAMFESLQGCSVMEVLKKVEVIKSHQ